MELIDFGARWYDPRIGRWLSPDTIIPDPANPQSLNRYSYVYGNPVKYIDEDGHVPIIPILLLAAAVWLSMEMVAGDGAPPHDPTKMYGQGIDAAIKYGADTPGDVYSLVTEYPENVGLNSAAVAVPFVSGGVLKALFRGTAVGWPGSKAMQATGIVPTSSDPLVSTLFALESASKGDGVLHIALPGDLDGVVIQPGSRGTLSALEQEFEVGIGATEFASKASISISVDQARTILGNMGFELPGRISSYEELNYYMHNTPRMTPEQVEEFIQQATELAE